MAGNFLAGQKLRASALNSALPILGNNASSTSITSSTTLVATGLSIPLDATSVYVIDGLLAYTAGATGDLKVALIGPTGATGTWGLFGLSSASTGGVGDVDARRKTAFTSATTQVVGGSDTGDGLCCFPHATIVTDAAGALVVWAAQNTSSATSSVLSSFSWLRAHRIGSA